MWSDKYLTCNPLFLSKLLEIVFDNNSDNYYLSLLEVGVFFREASMKTKIYNTTYLLIILCITISGLSAQTWIRSYQWDDLCPGPYTHGDAEVWNVIPAIGGGYLLQGHVEFIYGDIPAYESNVFWKIDENGDVVWRRTGSPHDGFVSMVSNGIDRYYCLVGGQLSVYDSEMNYLNYYLFTPINGYSVTLNDMLYDGDGLVFAGMSNTGQGIILKTDFQFDVVWQSVPLPVYGQGLRMIIHANNNRYSSFGRDMLVTVNTIGDTIWTSQIPHLEQRFYGVLHSSVSSVFALRRSYAENVFKLDLYNEQGENTSTNNTSINDVGFLGSVNVLQSNDNNIIVCIPGVQQLYKITLNGSTIWSRSYPSITTTGYGTNISLVDSSGCIVFCGGGTLSAMTLIRADSSGIVTSNIDEYSPPCYLSVSHYPNPVTSSFTVKINSEEHIINSKLEVFNLKGQRVLTKTFPNHSIECYVNLSEFGNDGISSGLYFYRVKMGTRSTKLNKLIIIK